MTNIFRFHGLGLHCRGVTFTPRHTIGGRTLLKRWWTRDRDLYLTTLKTLNRYPCLRRDSKKQNQRASCRTPLGHWDRH